MIRQVLAALAVTMAVGATAHAAPCSTAGEKSSRAVRLDPSDAITYVTWAHAMDQVLNAAVLDLAKPEIGCARGEVVVGDETYVLTGENTDLFPRRAIPRTAGKPALFIAPVTDLSGKVSRGLGVEMRYSPGASYAVILLDDQQATAVRVYKKLPTDEVLLRDVADILRNGGQPFARMARPNGEVAIIVGEAPER